MQCVCVCVCVPGDVLVVLEGSDISLQITACL